jgi:hypothetical protein
VQTTKLNLALFYLSGMYFHLSKARATPPIAPLLSLLHPSS